MSQSSRMLVAGKIKQKLRRIFFETPCRLARIARLAKLARLARLVRVG